MFVLDMHIETPGTEINLESFLDKPLVVSIAPRHAKHFTPQVVKAIRDILKNKAVLGQQGLFHTCPFKEWHEQNKWADRAHENYCLWRGAIPKEEQEKTITEGREFLKRMFGTVPIVYSPPNHLYDETTIELLSKYRYKYITDLGYGISPYKKDGVVVIPERRLKDLFKENLTIGFIRKSRMLCPIYIHYNEISKEMLDLILDIGLAPVDKLEAQDISEESIQYNKNEKIWRKIARDKPEIFKKAPET